MKPAFHRRTDLALHALRVLGTDDGAQPGSFLARQIGTSVSFLPQIMAPLIQGGWVVSERGPGGGYRLTDRASDATLLDVIEATEGPAEDGRCILRDAPCPGSLPCAIHAVWTDARQVLMEGFSRIPVLSTDHRRTRNVT